MTNLILSLSLVLLVVAVIAYPLFFQKLSAYQIPIKNIPSFNKKEALLSALSDLEMDYQMGRISEPDYQRLKLHLQRSYLELKNAEDGL